MTFRPDREILKTTKLYADGKTQVPSSIIKLLHLKTGSQIVWIWEKGKIVIEPSTGSEPAARLR